MATYTANEWTMRTCEMHDVCRRWRSLATNQSGDYRIGYGLDEQAAIADVAQQIAVRPEEFKHE